ncbi:protein-glutamate O-methyltransferase CheR [Luteitalea sp.]|uniref:CheR family methyltransferase n=1 Tax=Luteitalea sp. TaxID=2004800 RepID=UPI000A525BDF|nr:protein-glutamate O-methyltransferase CheR [Luteitalea sp.]
MTGVETTPDDRAADVEFELLLEAIWRRYSYDFRHYARASLRRRVTSAMRRLGVERMSLLQEALLRDVDLFTRLLTMLSVPVSDFFRDPAYFTALRQDVLPMLATYPSLKIWVAGCSTGEEVHSIAILLDELGLLDRALIYATDINPEALRTAEAGVYPQARVPGFTRNYQAAGGTRSLSDYYTAAYDRVVFDRRLRARVAFSDHSLATDAVFAEVQLVSCRNVLIYFDRVLQARAVQLFHDALVPRGFLGIGSRESLHGFATARSFEVVSREQRLYRRLA